MPKAVENSLPTATERAAPVAPGIRSGPDYPAPRLPEQIMRTLKMIGREENSGWWTGQISGTCYHGAMEHYAFPNKVFSLYSYVNLRQRNLCLSGARLEGAVIAMPARMVGADATRALNPADEVCGAITSGGTGGIATAPGMIDELMYVWLDSSYET